MLQATCFPLYSPVSDEGVKHDLQVSFSTILISLSLSLSLHPPDGPGAESCPPSHPRPPTHRQKEARLLQRLPAEVQLTGEKVFFWRWVSQRSQM